MLDDLTMIHHRDTQDALGAVERQPRQLAERFVLPDELHLVGGLGGLGGLGQVRPVRNIVFAGMGGSALGGMVVRAWMKLGVPFEVVRDYDLPDYVGPETLCIVVGYSGNTEETVSAFKQAHAKQAQIVVVSCGGELKELAAQAGVPFILLPTAVQPQLASWSVVKAAATIIEKYGLAQGGVAELEAQQTWFAGQVAQWRPDVPTFKNEAKQVALELAGKSVAVQGGPKLWPAAYSWKVAINENAKQVAWAGQYPEISHNEFVGWTRQPTHKPYAIVELRSNLEHPQVQKHFEVSERLLSGLRPAPTAVHIRGETLLRQLLYASALGNFVSVYLALLGGIDPSSARAVDKLKKELERN